MNVLLMGASGMVGGGVLRELLADADITSVFVVGRSSCGVRHPKLREELTSDLFNVAPFAAELSGIDACIWTIGVSSVGLDAQEYGRLTHDLTIKWAQELLTHSPYASFCYCSAGGAGGRGMWAQTRQRVERALQEMPFKHSGAVRPGFIRPAPGVRSKTRAYQAGAAVLAAMGRFYNVFPALVPALFTTSERLGRAMINVVKGKVDRFILESKDINRFGLL